MSTNQAKTTDQSNTAPTPPKNKTISFKDITKQNKRMNQLSTYILNHDYETNTNQIIKYYETFDQLKIEALLTEAYSNLQYAEEHSLTFFEGENKDSRFVRYVQFLIAVRFTSLSKDVPTTLPEQIPMFLEMISDRLFERIFEEVLPPDEVSRVMEKLEQFTSLVNKIANLEESTRNEILSKVKNKEILGSLNPHKDVIHPLVNPPVSPTVDDIDG